MGTTLTAAIVEGDEVSVRPRRRQPRLPVPRRRARAADPRPLAGRGAAPPGPAHRRAGRGPPAALDHHPGARPRAARSRSTRMTVQRAPRRRLPALLRRPDDDGRRGARSPAILERRGRSTTARRASWSTRPTSAGGRDNITVVAFRLEDAEAAGRGRRGRDPDRPERRGGGADRRASARRRAAGEPRAASGASAGRRSAAAAALSAPPRSLAGLAGHRRDRRRRRYRHPPGLLPRHRRGRPGRALPRPALRPAARDRALHARATSSPVQARLAARATAATSRHRPRPALPRRRASPCSRTSEAAATTPPAAPAAARRADGDGRQRRVRRQRRRRQRAASAGGPARPAASDGRRRQGS